jgi:serine/threonine protein kinase
VYESASWILLITEFCEGGELVPYITNAFNSEKGGLRTEDVSRISFQLLSAVDHCAKHGVIHRDIKPGKTNPFTVILLCHNLQSNLFTPNRKYYVLQ